MQAQVAILPFRGFLLGLLELFGGRSFFQDDFGLGYEIVIIPKDVARNLSDGSDKIVVEYDGE